MFYMALNEIQQKFAVAFTEDGPACGNAIKAAMAAGYPADQAATIAPMLLKDEQVTEFIRLANRSAAEKLGITVRWLLETFRENYLKCTEPMLVKDKKGNQVFFTHPDTGEQVAMCYHYNATAAKGFGEMLAKHLKMLTDRVETDVGSRRSNFQAQPVTAEEAARRYQAFMASQK